MGKGKARRRRQANFEAAHPASDLGPPPKEKDINAVPSKLRRIMQYVGASARDAERNKETNRASLQKHKGGSIEAPKAAENPKKRKRDEDIENTLKKDTSVTRGIRARQKSYLNDKKKKKKNKQGRNKVEDDDSLKRLYEQENVAFGEVVDAPPKLPRLKKVGDGKAVVSQERVRLQAMEAYRKKRGWSLRPGLKLL